MPQEFDLGVLLDEGEVGQPRIGRAYALAPLYDEGTVGAPTFRLQYGPTTGTDLPAGAPANGDVLPEVALQLVDLDHVHVGWLPLVKAGAAARHDVGGPGAITTTLMRSDPALADVDFENTILRYWYRGELVAAALLSDRGDKSVSEREADGEEAALGGPGTLAIFDEFVVDPWRLEWFPDMNTMRFSVAHPDYPDDEWRPARTKADGNTPGILWTGYPLGYTDPLAQWISGTAGDASNAPPGIYHFRDNITVPGDEGTVRRCAAIWGGDNTAEVWLDGVEQGVIQNWQKLQRVEIDLSAGDDHVLYSKVRNAEDDGPPGGNPAGFRFTLYGLGPQGELAEVLYRTRGFPITTCRVLERPAAEPGWTHGMVLNWLLDRYEAFTGRTIARTFTDRADSGGVPFIVYPEIPVQCGQTLSQVLDQFAENDLDVAMAAGSWTMHAWRKGGRGSTLPVAYTDGVNLLDLEHLPEPPLATSLLIRYETNWTRIDRDPPEGHRRRSRHLQLPTVRSAEGAAGIANAVLDAYGRVRTQYRAVVLPVDIDGDPLPSHVIGIAVNVGDTVTLPDIDGNPAPVRVTADEIVCDRDGNVTTSIEAGDEAWLAVEKTDAWLQRLADGALAGRTRQALADRFDRPRWTASTLGLQPIPPFDRAASAGEFESNTWTAAAAGVIVELHVNVPGGEGGTFDLRLNGATVATVTNIPAQFEQTTLGLGVHYDRGAVFTVYSEDTGFAAVVTPRCA